MTIRGDDIVKAIWKWVENEVFNWRPGDAHVHLWTRLALVQVMSCRSVSTNDCLSPFGHLVITNEIRMKIHFQINYIIINAFVLTSTLNNRQISSCPKRIIFYFKCAYWSPLNSSGSIFCSQFTGVWISLPSSSSRTKFHSQRQRHLLTLKLF